MPGEIHRPGDAAAWLPGGKADQRRPAARGFGLPATVVPVVAAGTRVAWLEAPCAREGIEPRPVHVPGETRTCLSMLDRRRAPHRALRGRTDARWRGTGQRSSPRSPRSSRATAEVIGRDLRARSHPGSPVDGYARIVALAADRRGPHRGRSDGAALARAVAAGPWLVKVNASEAARATGLCLGRRGGGGSSRGAGAAGAGAAIALVSRGSRARSSSTRPAIAWRVGPSPELGPYPVGSGDSALAGFLPPSPPDATTERPHDTRPPRGRRTRCGRGRARSTPPRWPGSWLG